MNEESLLGPRGRAKDDRSDDRLFYRQPRLVAHIDDAARATVTELYRTFLAPIAPHGAVLDMMSSRYSHLPDDLALDNVTGMGMNADELAANPQLARWSVHDLNADPHLPYDDATFAVVLNTVSVQYLEQPIAVFREVARLLQPGGTSVVAFSNRMFATKAIRAWRERDDEGHIALVTRYFELAGGFAQSTVFRRAGTQGNWLTPGNDPLYAVSAQKR